MKKKQKKQKKKKLEKVDPAEGLKFSTEEEFEVIPLLDAITDPDDREQVRQIIEDVERFGYKS